MIKTFKVYLIYIKVNNSVGEYELYAYTEKKKVYKEFMKLRNEKLFLCKKEEMDRNELNNLYKTYQRGWIIDKKIIVYDEDNNAKEMTIYMTQEEEFAVESKCNLLLLKERYECCWTDPEIFCKELREALRTLGYINLNYEITGKDTYYGVKDDIKMIVDYFSVFCKMYGDTLI